MRGRSAPFERLAAERGIPFRVLDMQVPQATIEQRLAERQRRGGDPSEADRAVMLRQCERLEPLTESERAVAIEVDNGGEHPIVPATGLGHARGLGDDTAGAGA